ncbi:MAG: hypothetical protein H7Y89_14080, partial [Steroidobacteraceae bacterium]|nr:hypothetical protein [Steroidobacteraceae bacterium]
MGAISSRLWLWITCICLAASAAAQVSVPAIEYVEPVSLDVSGRVARFDAFGRRFDLTLADNDRILRKLGAARKAELRSYQLLRGAVDGRPGSWVRLLRSAAGIEGAIWDGEELYAVTQYARVSAALDAPIDAALDQTVMYRLSDVRDALPKNFCALDAAAAQKVSNGLDHYQVLVSELRAGLTPAIARQIEISLIGDREFQQAESADPTAALLARLNIVEGIFSEQVGLLVLATDLRLMPEGADPLTSTTGGVLLDQLGAYREANAAVRARGLAHLVTGKDLDGNTAGIAYVGTVCDAKLGVSLSQRSFGTTISALIMAHELGHNFGAAHDGEPGTPCPTVNGGYIMAPSVSGFASFSQCSVSSMRPVIRNASCVSAAEYADATFDATTPVAGEAGLPFDVPFVVRSAGNVDAEQVTATIVLPATSGYAIESATSSQGSCAVSGFTATCSLGTIIAGTTASVSLSGRGSAAANLAVTARVSATNDHVNSNDTASVTVAVRSGIDAALAMSAGAAEIPVGAQLDVYADVASRRALAVRGAVLSITLNQPVMSASMGGANCTASAFSVNCTITEIPAGNTRRLAVRVKGTTAGPVFASGNVSIAGDGDYTNNTANASAWVRAARDVEVTAGPATVDLGVGSIQEIPYVIRSRGSQPTGDVSLVLSLPSNALVVDSIDAGGAACAQVDPMTWRCDLGALAPGASRGVRLRVHGTRPVNADVHASAEAADDGYAPNNYAGVQLRIDHLVDVAVTMATGGSGIEDAPLSGQITLRSIGRQTAVGATFEIELHAAGTLQSAKVHAGADCALMSSTRARCTLPSMARNALLFIDYTALFAEPGSYDVTFSAVAQNDTASDNDEMTRAVLVRPHNDIAIAGNVDLPAFLVGQTREKTFTLTADRRALTTARFVAPHFNPGLRVDAIQLGGGASVGLCRVESDGGICDFTDFPAYGSETVTVTYRAAEGSFRYDALARVSTPGDVSAANDVARGRVDVQAATDLDLRVGASASGLSATTFDLPAITIVNGASTAFAARLDVTLPPDISLVGISAANIICTGTDVIRCDFGELEANSSSTVIVSVRAARAGTFSAALHLSASNDTNAANDSRNVTLQISAAASE